MMIIMTWEMEKEKKMRRDDDDSFGWRSFGGHLTALTNKDNCKRK